MTQTATLTASSVAPANGPNLFLPNPADLLMNLIVTLLAPIFLAVADGTPSRTHPDSQTVSRPAAGRSAISRSAGTSRSFRILYAVWMPTTPQYLIPAFWILWMAYWAIAASGTKQVLRTESMASRVSHLVPLGLGIILLLFRHAGGRFLATPMYPASPWSLWIGIALVGAGLGFAAWARIHLAGNWSGTVTLKQDHSLTRTRPYRLTRHPIYTGLLTAILGTAIAEAEWHAMAAMVLITLSFLRKIKVEERFLLAQFGTAYARYQAEVPALIPGRVRWPAESA